MTRIGYPQSGLTALLDALERELLAAQAEEVRDACRETGRARNIACQEIRVLLNEAIAASEDGSAATPNLNSFRSFGRRDWRKGRVLQPRLWCGPKF